VARRIRADRAPGWVCDRLAGLAGTRWVGVDGFGASGKSTLARAIADCLPGSVVVSIDDFARPGVAQWERKRFARELVGPLLAGRAARYQRWPYDSAEGLDWVEVPAGVPVIVEGVSSTDIRLPVPWDLTVWVDAPPEVRWQRIVDRDPPALQERWRTEWMPGEQAYATEQSPINRADAIVSGG
jgi:hypothetical protein